MAPAKKQLDVGFFAPISKEEMESRSELKFVVLNDKLEKERSMTKHALPKRPVERPRMKRCHFLSQRSSGWSILFQNQGAAIKIGLLLPFGLLFSKQCNKVKIVRMHWCTWGQLIDNQDPYIAPMTILQGIQWTGGSIPMAISKKITSIVWNLARLLTDPDNTLLYSMIILPLEMIFAMYLESNALAANHSPMLSSSPW